MRKQATKKLFTFYTVEGKLDDIKKTDHKIASYCNGKAECKKYHNLIIDWINEITSNGFKAGFGIEVLGKDGKNVTDHNYTRTCTSAICERKSMDEVVKRMADIITYYFSDIYYYEIEDDTIISNIELTGHMYYKSPYESCDGCGNCDGAKCDTCKVAYTVEDYKSGEIYYYGFNKEEAKKIENSKLKNYSDIITDILENYQIDMEWFNKEIGDNASYTSLFKIINKYKIPYITMY